MGATPGHVMAADGPFQKAFCLLFGPLFEEQVVGRVALAGGSQKKRGGIVGSRPF